MFLVARCRSLYKVLLLTWEKSRFRDDFRLFALVAAYGLDYYLDGS